MYLLGWLTWYAFLTLLVSTCGLEISGYDDHEVICSQGLSNCTVEDEMLPRATESDVLVVQNLTAHFKLCCMDKALCTLCMVIDAEISINPDKGVEDEDFSGYDEDNTDKEMRNSKASVTVCYNIALAMPTCKKVEFTVNHPALTQQPQAKFSMVIRKPAGIFFSSHVTVFYSKSLHVHIVAPSLNEVCSHEQERVEECHVPKLKIEINHEMNRVELQSEDSNESLPSVCVQYEENGICKRMNRTRTRSIPLHSVTPCMFFQAWYEDDQRPRRSRSCPFINTDIFRRNVWSNVTVSVGPGQMIDYRSKMWWNLSAPCRLEAEVWPCHRESSCREMKGFRQQVPNDTWRQNSKGLWEITGVFEDINLQLSPCVMMQVKGMEYKLGPFCFDNTDRWRWSLLVVGVMLLVCLSALIFYLLHNFVKKWVWSWRHGGFVQIGSRRHVVVLSPPDMDDGVSQAVCQLGSRLSNQGFSVSVDQWSRKEQCILGPLPWLHSQLLELDSHGGRVVLVLTPKAMERAEEWTHRHEEVMKMKGEDPGRPQIGSPYSDVFMASLCLIQADKQLGRAGERFLLVRFDSSPRIDRGLPELLQGLLLFQLPSQTQALVTELTVGGAEKESGRRTWTWWRWRTSDGWRARTKGEPDQQRASHCKYAGVGKGLETVLLKHP